jgi:hypothetical protein
MAPVWRLNDSAMALAAKKKGRASSSDAEQDEVEPVDLPVALQQGVSRQGDEGPAGTVTQQGQADDHVGKVVPLDDGEQPHQQDLVAECGARDQGDGKAWMAGRCPWRCHCPAI